MIGMMRRLRCQWDENRMNACDFEIRQDDLTHGQTLDLLAFHLSEMNLNSPACSVFALDSSGLQHPDVTVWTAWSNMRVAAVGALRISSDGTAEIKSMRTHPDFLRMGAAGAILATIIAAAKSQRIRRLSLETGSGPAFEPALALYRRHGFANGSAFGAYQASDFNQFLHLDLE